MDKTATHKTTDYILRSIPPDLWRKAKHRAVDDGVSLRDLLLRALREYLTKKSA